MILPQWLNPEVFKLLLVLFLSFLIGLQREERKVAEEGRYAFGGVRTFPLIGLIGYLIAFLSGKESAAARARLRHRGRLPDAVVLAQAHHLEPTPASPRR